MSVTLRPYQEKCLREVEAAQLRGVTRMLVVAATGTGKTTMFCELARAAAGRGERTLILAHRDELIDQAARRIRQQVPGLRVGIEAAKARCSETDQVVIASVASIGKVGCPRLEGQTFGLVVTDEAHHAAADSYGHVYNAHGVYEGKTVHVGVTATPHRLDNKPLHGDDAIFEEVAFNYGIRNAIKDGWLCDIRGFRVETDLDISSVKKTAGDYAVGQLERVVNTEARNELALEYWTKVAGKRRTIVFCVGVAHSHAVAELFGKAGIKAASVVGNTPGEIRADAISKFRSGEIQVLTNVNVLTEGFDVPEMDCILLLRPTQSWSLYAQMVGRGLRTSPGKRDCAVIDVCDITTKHSLAHAPGLLGLPREASNLEGRELMGTLEALERFGKGLPLPSTSRLVSIQLLANMGLPDFFSKAQMDWMPAPGGRFSLSLAEQGDRGRVRAELAVDPLGCLWMALRDQNGIYMKRKLAGELSSCVRQAEMIIQQQFGDVMKLVGREARWKPGPASEKQIAYLIGRGVEPDAAAGMTAGEASKFISLFISSSAAFNG